MPELNVVIRKYSPADRSAVLRLAERLTCGTAGWLDREAVAAAARDWVLGSIAAIGENAALFVAEGDKGNCLGFVSVAGKTHFTGKPQAYVGELVVASEAEGKGIGSGLMRTVEEWATARGYHFVTLETGAANERARRFYRQLGYLEESVTLTRPLH